MKKHDAVRLRERFHDVPVTDGKVVAVFDDNVLVDFGEGFTRMLPAEVLQKVPAWARKPKLAVA